MKAVAERDSALQGMITTVMFIAFFIMHISLSAMQYNVT